MPREEKLMLVVDVPLAHGRLVLNNDMRVIVEWLDRSPAVEVWLVGLVVSIFVLNVLISPCSSIVVLDAHELVFLGD